MRSSDHHEIDPFGSHIRKGCLRTGNRILRHDAIAQLMKYCVISASFLAKIEHFSFQPAVNHKSDLHILGANKDTAYDIQEPDQAKMQISSTIADKMAPKKMMKEDVLVHK